MKKRRYSESNEEHIVETKKDIRLVGLKALKNYLESDVEKVDRKDVQHLYQKAKLGFQFDKEMNVNQRINENNRIRVFKIIAENKDELKQYLHATMPGFLPEEKKDS